MTIARYPSFVIDCPDPGALATFYAERAVLELEATRHAHRPSEAGSFRVLLDPAGHPLCLCRS